MVPQKQVVEGMKVLVGQSDLADLPMEDLRKWGCWDLTDFVLTFADKPSHNSIPIVKRAILRFALAAPADHAKAKAYVEVVRKQDPERVKFVEQTLKDEQPKPAATQQATTPPAGKPGGVELAGRRADATDRVRSRHRRACHLSPPPPARSAAAG